MAEAWCVVVRHNLVHAIERAEPPPGTAVAATPLDVSTRLADNNKSNGCLDGRYWVADAASARVFATLCLEFTRATAEKRLAAMEKLPAGNSEYDAGEG